MTSRDVHLDPGREVWRHICVDMQMMFADRTPWVAPWLRTIFPRVHDFIRAHPRNTIFTRFMPPDRADDMKGSWRDYYEKWWMMTGEHLHDGSIDILPALRALAPDVPVIDKMTYSPWTTDTLHHHLQDEGVTGLVISGGETDVCVLATVFGAIDHGYKVIILRDAVYSSADAAHDSALRILEDRFSVHVGLSTTGDAAFLSETHT